MFTNVDNIFNLNFNISSLKEYIRTDIEHYLFTENPICKLEKIQTNLNEQYFQANYVVREDMLHAVKQAFEQTTKTILEMYDIISHFQPVYSSEFSKIYNLKEEIEKQYLRLNIQHQQLLATIVRLNEGKK